MNRILKVHTVHDYNTFVGHADMHPLVSVIEYAKVSPILHTKGEFAVYGLFLLDDTLEELTYGHIGYEYEKGTLVCVSPGQTGGVEYNGNRFERRGWALLFHPDLLHGTSLKKAIREYSFFEYSANEALHMTESEREIYISLLKQLQRTLKQTDNGYRDSIIVAYIELILKYCKRFYDRQFTTQEVINNHLLNRFESLLADYFSNEEMLANGIPTVAWCAQELCLSPNYFGDLIKKETGKSPTEYIRQAVVKVVKNKLITGISSKQIAYEMGFERSQDLSRMFKKYTGETLSEYVKRTRLKT